MELALYEPSTGYYARAAQRSGRAGDFFTSVDVGPLFGQVIAEQVAEMADVLSRARGSGSRAQGAGLEAQIDLVEAGAGNGRLSADILTALEARRADVYGRTRLHLVERSAAARDAQPTILGPHTPRLASSSSVLPESFEGVLVANELLDAMPVHQVVMRDEGLREIYVAVQGGLTTFEGPPSTPALARYLSEAGVSLEPGWRAEIPLAAAAWIRTAARALGRGFIMLFDYGHEARELYSVTHSSGTLTTFSRHAAAGPESGAPVWLARPGEQDLTAHVDFTTIQNTARAEGLTTVAFLDQTYFMLGILQGSPGLANAASRRALKTLLMPGGLGSTMKVLILGKDVGAPALAASSFSTRVT